MKTKTFSSSVSAWVHTRCDQMPTGRPFRQRVKWGKGYISLLFRYVYSRDGKYRKKQRYESSQGWFDVGSWERHTSFRRRYQ